MNLPRYIKQSNFIYTESTINKCLRSEKFRYKEAAKRILKSRQISLGEQRKAVQSQQTGDGRTWNRVKGQNRSIRELQSNREI